MKRETDNAMAKKKDVDKSNKIRKFITNKKEIAKQKWTILCA